MSREKIIEVMCDGWVMGAGYSIEGRCKSLLNALEAAGYAIVPVEPTEKMLEYSALNSWQHVESHEGYQNEKGVYRAMIQSAKGK